MGATGAAEGDPSPSTGLPVPLGHCRAVPEAPLEPSCPKWRLKRRPRKSPALSSRGGFLPGLASPRRPIPASMPVGSSTPCPRLGGGPEAGSAAGHHPQDRHTRGLEGQTASWAAFVQPDYMWTQCRVGGCGAQAQPSFRDLRPHPTGLRAQCPEPRVRLSLSASLGARPSVSPGGCGTLTTGRCNQPLPVAGGQVPWGSQSPWSLETREPPCLQPLHPPC